MCLAIPGKIVEFVPASQNTGTAIVDVVGVRRRVDLGLLENDPPQIGDWVLIHVGFAMSKISEQDATDQMNTLALLGEAEAAMQEVRGYGSHDQPLTEGSGQIPLDSPPIQESVPEALRKFEPS